MSLIESGSFFMKGGKRIRTFGVNKKEVSMKKIFLWLFKQTLMK